MERVLFDCTYYQGSDYYHGGGEYGDVVLRQLLKRGLKGSGVFFRRQYGFSNEIINAVKLSGWNLHSIDRMKELPDLVKEYEYTTIYTPLPYLNNWYWFNGGEGIRFVGTFHGLRMMELGFYEDCNRVFYEGEQITILPSSRRRELVEVRKEYDQALKSFISTQIVTVSEHSKYSILHYYPEIDEKSIIVLYSPEKHYENTISKNDEKALFQRIGIEKERYALMTSANIWYKNPRRAVEAFDMIFSKQYSFVPEEYRVLVICKENNRVDLLKGIKNKERFVFSDYVKSGELESLYQNAHMFVYPSLNEGFGYPPLEAMKYETPCVCSGNASISEVCKDMVWYFNPLDIDEMAIRLMQAFSEDEREKKIRRIRDVLPKIRERQQTDLNRLIDLITGNNPLD